MKFGRYEIVKKLGEGAMGVVYQAHDPHIDREVALKVLKEDRVESENFVQRFLKEAKAIGRLNHPNIVTVYDIGQDHKTVYIAMEFLEGKPLDEVIGEKKLGLQEVVDIGSQLARALGYAHDKGIVHRDIKPTNIILTSDNQVKLTDFGIARIEDPSAVQMTQAGEILGTPSYMSPEQVLGKPVDGRSDLFSLGVFLYRITTGKRPFRGSNLGSTFRAITTDTPEPPLKLDPTVSKPLSSLIVKSLSKDPKDRFQTGEEMKEALLACIEKSPEPTSGTESRKQKLNIGLLFLAFFLLIGSAGGFIYFKFFMPCLKVVPQATSCDDIRSLGFVCDEMYQLSGTVPKGDVMSLTPDVGSKAPCGSTIALVISEGKDLQAVLNIESIPTSADVFINGEARGKTPLKLYLPLEKYEVRVSMQGYYEYEAQIKLDKEGEIPVLARLISKD